VFKLAGPGQQSGLGGETPSVDLAWPLWDALYWTSSQAIMEGLQDGEVCSRRRHALDAALGREGGGGVLGV
jgi:hypothetical protein